MTPADDGTVVGRVVLIMEIVAARGCASLADIARESMIPKPTVRRIAGSLVVRNMLSRCVGGYELGTRIGHLGSAALGRHPLRETAPPVLQELYERSGEIAFASSVTQDELITLGVAFGAQRVPDLATRGGWPDNVSITSQMPFSAVGRIVLSARPGLMDAVVRGRLRTRSPRTQVQAAALVRSVRQVCVEGISVERDEHTPGWACTAAGIRDAQGSLVGIVGITGRSTAFDPGRLSGPVQRAAESLSRAHAREPARLR